MDGNEKRMWFETDNQTLDARVRHLGIRETSEYFSKL